jgi:hypothetical protein
MNKHFNHSPFIHSVWVPFNGQRFKNPYMIRTRSGEELIAIPNGIGWQGPNQLSIEDSDVVEIKALPDGVGPKPNCVGGRRIVRNYQEALAVLEENKIAVIVDPKAEIRKEFHPDLLVDAILAKKNLGTTRDMAPLTIALAGFCRFRKRHRFFHVAEIIHQPVADADCAAQQHFTASRVDAVVEQLGFEAPDVGATFFQVGTPAIELVQGLAHIVGVDVVRAGFKRLLDASLRKWRLLFNRTIHGHPFLPIKIKIFRSLSAALSAASAQAPQLACGSAAASMFAVDWMARSSSPVQITGLSICPASIRR